MPWAKTGQNGERKAGRGSHAALRKGKEKITLARKTIYGQNIVRIVSFLTFFTKMVTHTYLNTVLKYSCAAICSSEVASSVLGNCTDSNWFWHLNRKHRERSIKLYCIVKINKGNFRTRRPHSFVTCDGSIDTEGTSFGSVHLVFTRQSAMCGGDF